MGWDKRNLNAASKMPADSGARWLAGFSNWPIFIIGVLLSAFGLLMIYSSSAVMGLQKYGDALYYVKKQGVFLALGWALYFMIAQIPLVKLSRLRMIFLFVGLGLLFLVLIPGIGSKAGGAQRWLSLAGLRFQPSELARLLLVFYLSATLTIRADRLQSFNKGFLPLLIISGLMMILLILQPDFGGAMSVLVLSVALWFMGGIPMTYLGGLFILTLPAVLILVMKAGYRAKRVMTFLDPWADPQGSGFQVIQSYMAFFQGGWSGVGIGNSQQKLFYLPEAHTDFIFSVIGEELGVIGIIVVVGLFLSLLYCGARVARSQLSTFGYYLGCGVTLFVALPAMLNMMVTLGLLPTKGLPLPFFSSGGSSLLVSLMALGVLQSLHHRRDVDAA
ncbi:MAG: putative lipid II flippase FtsW [Deltaproteobacteria bacterium]|nr:putative lipid II flippase FtsW [Deltaproteobacteria bacterium]